MPALKQAMSAITVSTVVPSWKIARSPGSSPNASSAAPRRSVASSSSAKLMLRSSPIKARRSGWRLVVSRSAPPTVPDIHEPLASAACARACAETGLVFVGPAPETLDLFGDKAAARAMARRCEVPVLPGTDGPTSLEEARAFLAGLGPDGAIMIKALAGGGGRGMRPVHHHDDLPAAFERCRSEAQAAFGNGAVYVERLFPRARHIEVQVVGDGSGTFAEAMGLVMDGSGFGLGKRSKRYAAIIEDGTITNLAVDESGIEQSACSNILSML